MSSGLIMKSIIKNCFKIWKYPRFFVEMKKVLRKPDQKIYWRGTSIW